DLEDTSILSASGCDSIKEYTKDEVHSIVTEDIIEVISIEGCFSDDQSTDHEYSKKVLNNDDYVEQDILAIDNTCKENPVETERKGLCCHLCEKTFRTQSRFDGHMREHRGLKPAVCKICGKDFIKWYNLKMHMAHNHSNQRRTLFPCDYEGCGLRYATKHGLSMHQLKHDPEYTGHSQKQFICEICGKAFSTIGVLKKHSFLHTGNMPFKCEICTQKFAASYNLKQHMMRHQGIKNYECSYCGMKKATSNELKVHMNFHTKEIKFTCDICRQVFSHAGNLARHIKTVHHGIKEFKCPHCDRYFGKLYTLKKHIQTHTGEKPYECSICSKRYIQLISLQMHAKKHLKNNLEDASMLSPSDSWTELSGGEIKTRIDNELSSIEPIAEIAPMEPTFVKVETCETIDNDVEQSINSELAAQTSASNEVPIKHNQAEAKSKLLSCQLCEQKFRSQSRYDGHLREHQGLKPALCSICGKDFTEWNRLKQHMANKHPAPDQEAFPCDYEGCRFSYKTRKGLTAHRKTHNPNFTRPVPKKCVCETCGKTFSSSGTLKKHSYIHTGILPFHCEICDKKHPTAHKLKVHMMRHQGIKNYECSLCGLKKTTSDELKAHMNNHTKAKVYVCEHCGQVFTSSGNMSRHVNIVHRGMKEFKCPHCERCFGKSETLKHHIMTHTGEKPYECDVCMKRFIQLIALQTHKKTHATFKDGSSRLKRANKKPNVNI
uniref:C2H2-type domain-containing protein n=1 Tax=Anopheles dirus TaxID=7168 RepID=A0A182NC86_9DIPT